METVAGTMLLWFWSSQRPLRSTLTSSEFSLGTPYILPFSIAFRVRRIEFSLRAGVAIDAGGCESCIQGSVSLYLQSPLVDYPLPGMVRHYGPVSCVVWYCNQVSEKRSVPSLWLHCPLSALHTDTFWSIGVLQKLRL